MRVSVIIPCLDEAATVGQVIAEVRAALAFSSEFEILIVDDGSVDDSVAIARASGARVVSTGGCRTGTGSAYKAGVNSASGDLLVFLDADGEHDPASIPVLLAAFEKMPGLILGSRDLGGYDVGARSWLHRSFGTPLLTALLNHYLGTRVSDCNTGFRAISRTQFKQLNLRSKGFEVASEMIAVAAQQDISIVEVPIYQRAPPPGRQPHLRRWRDGWRHLKTIVLHAPDRVLLRPGLSVLLLGALMFLPQIFGPLRVGPIHMDIHLMILGALLLFIGAEMLGSAMLCATLSGGPRTTVSARMAESFTLEHVLPWAALLFVAGFAADLGVVVKSGINHWQGIMEPRLALVGTVGMGLAVQLTVLAFVHSVIVQNEAS